MVKISAGILSHAILSEKCGIQGDDSDFESLMAELMDELDGSLIRHHPSLCNDCVDQVILAVPEPAHRFGLRGGVWAALGELDSTRAASGVPSA